MWKKTKEIVKSIKQQSTNKPTYNDLQHFHVLLELLEKKKIMIPLVSITGNVHRLETCTHIQTKPLR